MINSLHITNFQSHKDSTLEFDSGVNVIVGLSDSGKSSIIRALRWLIWNRPIGEEFRSNWGGLTEVSLGVDGKGNGVMRSRGTTDNSYFMELDGALINFEAVGTEVPEEVRRLLNIDEINLQEQHDGIFLLGKAWSPGSVAQHFNRIAHLEKIDIGTRNIQSWLSDIKRTITYNTSQLEQKKEHLKTYDYLEAMEVEVEILEEMQRQSGKLHNEEQQLAKIITALQEAEEELKEIQTITEDAPLVEQLLKCIEEQEETRNETKELEQLIEQIRRTEQQLQSVRKLIDLKQPFDELMKLIEQRERLEEEVHSINECIVYIEETEEELTAHTQQLNTLRERFDELMPDRCPLCNQKIIKK